MSEFDSIRDEHAILLDVTSLSIFYGNDWQIDDHLSSHLGNSGFDERLTLALRKIEDSLTLQRYLHFLENVIVFELLAFDKYAAEATFAALPGDFSAVMRGLSVPIDIYKKTSDAVIAIKQKYSSTSSEYNKQLYERVKSQNPDLFFSFGEKRLHDCFDRNNVSGIPRSLANTNDSFGRAIFYLEFSRSVGIPAVLSDSKVNWLTLIRKSVYQPIHNHVVNCIDEEVQKAAADFLGAGPDIVDSPVIELIINYAVDKNTTLSAAAMQIRESNEAKEYRKFLLELRKALFRGRKGIIDVGKIQKALRKVANTWATDLDIQLEISRKKRIIKLDKLPILGELLKMANMSDVEIRDIILSSPPGYLCFISSWYT